MGLGLGLGLGLGGAILQTPSFFFIFGFIRNVPHLMLLII